MWWNIMIPPYSTCKIEGWILMIGYLNQICVIDLQIYNTYTSCQHMVH